MFATSGLWAVVLAWTRMDPAFEPARTPVLLCTIAGAIAYAHNDAGQPPP